MNQFKNIKEERKANEQKERLAKISQPFVQLLTGEFIKRDRIVKALPFLFFLTLLGICYIANGYYAEKTIREIYKTNRDLKELRSEYITIKSELEIMKQQSQVAVIIRGLGLKESTTPPKKIIVNPGDR